MIKMMCWYCRKKWMKIGVNDMNKFMEKEKEIAREYNALSLEERKKIKRYRDGQRLLDFEQLKILLTRSHKRTMNEITQWENNILKGIDKE